MIRLVSPLEDFIIIHDNHQGGFILLRIPIKFSSIYTDSVVCMECGNHYQQLSSHLRNTHSMSSEEYSQKYPNMPLRSLKSVKSITGVNNPNYRKGNKVRKVLDGKENVDFIVCRECGDRVRMLTNSGHLRKHHMNKEQYLCKFPGSPMVCSDFSENKSPVSNFTYEERKKYSIQNQIGNPITYTKPHIKISNLLQDEGILHENEVMVFNHSVDINIDAKHIIEVQGNYWHSHPDKFNESNMNHIQRAKLSRDIEKHKFFQSRGVNILYLWEKDINDNYDLCKHLILSYLSEELSNYHSFNYLLQNGGLEIQPLKDFYY